MFLTFQSIAPIIGKIPNKYTIRIFIIRIFQNRNKAFPIHLLYGFIFFNTNHIQYSWHKIPNRYILICYRSGLSDSRPIDHHRLANTAFIRSEEHTSELQSRFDLVCRLLLEKKKKNKIDKK